MTAIAVAGVGALCILSSVGAALMMGGEEETPDAGAGAGAGTGAGAGAGTGTC